MADVKQLDDFGSLPDGRAVAQFELTDGSHRMRVIALGGVVTQLLVPDRDGRVANVALNLPDVAGYLSKANPYFGALVGRVANRIAYGKFTLDGETFSLPVNNGRHTLHGGAGYDRVLWAPSVVGNALKLTHTDPAGANGFPGTVHVAVTYTLSGGVWQITYEATTDRATPINLTQHAYFNLRDGGAGDVLGHELRVFAAAYTPSDAALIPTGAIVPVEGTPFDYTAAKPMGCDFAQLGNTPPGVDHNFVLDGPPGAMRPAAEVYEPVTGRTLGVTTTEPGLQVYTGNFLDGSVTGADGTAYGRYAGFCLESQHFPDSPNQPSFPSVILRPGETYRSTTEYRFGVR